MLNDYVQVVDLDIAVLWQRLNLAGLEVQAIEVVGYPDAELPWDQEKVITAEVLIPARMELRARGSSMRRS